MDKRRLPYKDDDDAPVLTDPCCVCGTQVATWNDTSYIKGSPVYCAAHKPNSNNPPAFVLELTEAQAKFLLNNCNTNIAFALNILQYSEPSRSTAEDLVALAERFKEIRLLLTKAGVAV